MHMAVVGATYRAAACHHHHQHPHEHTAADAGVIFSMAYPLPAHGGGSGSPYSSSASAASTLSPAAFGAAVVAPQHHGGQHHHHHLDVLDYFSDKLEGGPSSVPCSFGTPSSSLFPVEHVVPDASGSYVHPRSAATMMAAGELGARTDRIAFRTRSSEEILDDGYKWRKYGKKSVKNSPNPRNYYRCSTEGCNVKKRVERDRDDPSYVVTTYEGGHNHVSPGTVYYAAQDAASGRFFVAGMHHPGT